MSKAKFKDCSKRICEYIYNANDVLALFRSTQNVQCLPHIQPHATLVRQKASVAAGLGDKCTLCLPEDVDCVFANPIIGTAVYSVGSVLLPQKSAYKPHADVTSVVSTCTVRLYCRISFVALEFLLVIKVGGRYSTAGVDRKLRSGN